MQNISIPYGKGFLSCDIPKANLAGIYESRLPQAAGDPHKEVSNALDAPIASSSLEELARKAKNAVIIASDHTRPVPSKILMPQLLERLRKGNPAIKITILIATGFHRLTTKEELIAKFGEKIVEEEEILVHDSSKMEDMADLGTLPSGGKLLINKIAVQTDLLLSEGFIEPHFFAGFSGGRKSVLPGVASRETVLANHRSDFIASPFARTGILENNPIHKDMLFAAKAAKLAFILNVVIDGSKNIIKAFAGDPEEAHAAGCRFLGGCARIKVPEADIVITSNGGYPLDQNVYQSVKGMTAGESVTRKGGVIIICASCKDGHGGESFYKHLSGYEPKELLEMIAKIPGDQTVPDQWEYQILARILAERKVILVTRDCPHKMLEEMHLYTASDLEEALSLAFTLSPAGEKSRIAVIPDGVSVIAEKA